MKMNFRTSIILAATLIALPVRQIHAQDATGQANDISTPTLKQLMATNSIVTNTVGIVLVKISPGLWAGKFETTQSAYEKITHGNPSNFQGADRPVDSVSWNDAMVFCGKLTAQEQSAKELPDGFNYTLPTQSQWLSLMGDASVKDAVMKLNNPSSSSTAMVGSLGENSLGLFDTRGNVMEWCFDSPDNSVRVLKGGAWDTFSEVNARPEFRWYAPPDEAKNSYGFRVILSNASQ
jgi:formylglycine-generating enzyme required for sulfatase activity